MNSPESSPELITERARILRVSADTAWVHCESQAGCARCAAGEGCGAGLFAKLLRGRLQELPVPLPGELNDLVPGDWVLIGLSVNAIQNASFLLYGLPLIGLLFGATTGGIAIGSDAAALAGTVAGLAGGLGLAGWRGARLAGHAGLQPVLLRQLESGEPCPAGREA